MTFSMLLALKNQLISFLAYIVIYFISITSRIIKIGVPEKSGNVIYAFWHGRQFLLVYTHRFENVHIMTSLSKDGELQTAILSKFGYRLIRGSSSRRAAEATLEMMKRIESGYDVAFAVDGPRGPAFKVKPGIVFLAQKTNRVIIPVSTSAKRRKIFSNWDRYLLPFPFNYAVVVYGKPIVVTSEDDISHKCQEIEHELIRITTLADLVVSKKTL